MSDTSHAGPSTFPVLPTASSEPVPQEAEQHLEAKHKRLINLRPRRLSVSSGFSKTSSSATSKSSVASPTSSKSKRRKRIDSDVVELADEPECVISSELTTEDRQVAEDDESKDIYEWAILYENQRGITVFSIPYYSRLSLLPSDPPPFTVPSEPSGYGRGKAGQRTTLRAPASLADYQLPDPTWCWVSKFWMVDMRGDGEVQQDGYEYNWFFRSTGWRASIGSFNSGGWVRRRRWVRLMMRPASASNLSVSPSLGNTRDSSATPATLPAPADALEQNKHVIWRGDDGDWTRVRDALRDFRSDGRRLEAWEHWLGLEERALLAHASGRLGIGIGNGMKVRMDDWDLRHALDPVSPASNDATPGTAQTLTKVPPPPKEMVLAVFCKHFQHILATFIFPDSRAQFLELIRLAGYDENSIPGLTTSDSRSDFWSLARRATPRPSPSKLSSHH